MAHGLESLTTPPPFDAADAPVEATVSRGGRALGMAFAEGGRESVPAEAMRLGCRCAWCTRARAEGRFPERFPEAAIVAVDPIGGYAVHVVFADGHDRGIFPWTYLRALARDAETPAATETAAAA